MLVFSSSLSLIKSNDTPRLIPESRNTEVWTYGTLFRNNPNFHPYITSTDGEAVKGIYQNHGLNTATYLCGPFSCVIWDPSNLQVLAISDRSGFVPLYVRRSPSYIAFSDNIEELLDLDPTQPKPNTTSLVRLIYAQAPLPTETYYESIQVIEPGHMLVVRPDKAEQTCYWSVDFRPSLILKNDDEYAEYYKYLLTKVLRDYLPTSETGPIGVPITSGLDSNSLAAALSKMDVAKIIGFSMIAPNIPEADEYPFAAEVAQGLNIPLYTTRWDTNGPFSTPDGIATDRWSPIRHIYREAQRCLYESAVNHGISTFFSGGGGDYLFGSNVFAYPDLFLEFKWRELYRQLKLHSSLSRKGLNMILWDMLFRPLARMVVIPQIHRPYQFPVFLSSQGAKILKGNLDRPDSSVWMKMPGKAQRLSYLKSRLSQWFIVYNQREAQRFNLRLVDPLFDYRLMEFATCLPTSQTFHAGYRKWIVRNAWRDVLPENITRRWDKIYPMPIAEAAFKTHQEKVMALMTGMRLAEIGLIDEGKLRQDFLSYIEGKTSSGMFWYAISIEDWLRRWF